MKLDETAKPSIQTPITDPIRCTITQAANYVGVSDRTIRNWREDRKLRIEEDERGCVFSRWELDFFKAAQT